MTIYQAYLVKAISQMISLTNFPRNTFVKSDLRQLFKIPSGCLSYASITFPCSILSFEADESDWGPFYQPISFLLHPPLSQQPVDQFRSYIFIPCLADLALNLPQMFVDFQKLTLDVKSPSHICILIENSLESENYSPYKE